MKRRRLLSTRRIVPLDRAQAYDPYWERLREAATAAGARAWRFRAAGEPELFLEFLEFAEDNKVLDHAPVASARDALEQALGPGTSEEWTEAT
jgi:hypothetical protein